MNSFEFTLNYGYKELPNLPELLKMVGTQLDNWIYEEMDTSFFLSRENIVSTKGSGMSQWREGFFSWMTKNSTKASDYFSIPASRVVELGSQINI